MTELTKNLRFSVLIPLLLQAGCASTESAHVRLSYTVQPSRGLPAGMKTVAIQPAKVGPSTDPKWSELAANLLQSLVDESRNRFGTDLRVSDRRDTQVTFDEADLAAAGMSTGRAGSGGRLLAADGVILSQVNVMVEKHVGRDSTISGIDLSGLWLRRGGGGRVALESSEVETVTRNLTVQTDYKLVDASNNQLWDQYSATHSSTDSTSGQISPFFGGSRTEAELTPQDRIIGTLVEQGAREFISRLMPTNIETTTVVESSGNADCIQGVKWLRAEAYEDALSSFRAALAQSPSDHRAAYGAGVAAEALGQYEEALRFYNRAVAERDGGTYRQARDRVKAFGGRAGG